MGVFYKGEEIGFIVDSPARGTLKITENGVYDVREKANVDVNVEPTNDIPVGDYFVKVIDYDGTVLKETRLNTGDIFILPKNPSHDGLVFQEWSCSQEIVDGVITIADNNVMVGATYTTASGLNEFDIEITKAMVEDIESNGFTVTLNLDGNKWWAYNEDKVTSDTENTHTFYKYGKYTIACDGTTMTTSSSSGLFGQTGSVINYYCTAARLSVVTRLGSYAFKGCYSLSNIVISNNVTRIGGVSLHSCLALVGIVIPNGVDIIGNDTIRSCHSLKNIVIPESVRDIGSSTFSDCYSLADVVIPKALRSIPLNLFYNCHSLKNIVIPESVTSISGASFHRCYLLVNYDFSQYAAIPTLSNTSAFTGINGITKIIVPDALYDEWIVAANWATYADYIYKVSEI